MIRKRTFSFKPRLEALEDRCLLSAGALDPSFGSGGLVVTDLGSTSDHARAMVIQADGKIVTAGGTGGSGSGTGQDFALVRHNLNGTLDTSFGTNGRTTTDFKKSSDVANAVVQQADGKFVVAGTVTITAGIPTSSKTDTDFGLARYHANGTLDTSFGSNGKVMTTIGKFTDQASDMAMQTDGKIVVAGATWKIVNSISYIDIVVARYNANGSLDAAFGQGGIVKTDYAGQPDEARAVAIQTDGKIVVAGRFAGAGLGLVRYHPNGSLDLSFGSQGKVSTVVFGDLVDLNASATDIAIQADGKIVALANVSDRRNAPVVPFFIALARYNPNGSLDTTFDSDGIVTIQQPIDTLGNALAMQSNGKFVVAGYYHDSTEGFGSSVKRDFFLARVNSDGSPDATFGTGGVVRTDFGPTFGVTNSDDRANAVAIQADGKIVAAGSFGKLLANYDSAFDIALARYEGDAPLQAAAAAPKPTATTLRHSQVQPLLAEARARWQAAGVDTSGLGTIQLQIANLGGRTLGLASGHTITLDDNAAGWGWFVDRTPKDDSEFTTPGNQGEQNRIDLLTVLEHEIGHLLGHEHTEYGVMTDTLATGIRRIPGSTEANDWSALLDVLVSEPLSKRRR